MMKPEIKVVGKNPKIINSNGKYASIKSANGFRVPIPQSSRYNSKIVNSVSNNKYKFHISKKSGLSHNEHKRNSQSHDKILLLKNAGIGKSLVMLAPGPSILESDISRLAGVNKIDVVTINKPDSRLWPTKYWMFCDQSQYRRNASTFHDYEGTIINTTSINVRKDNQILIKGNTNQFFSRDLLDGINVGRSTVFACMQVALWMNYTNVFVLGCDMTRVNVMVDNKETSLLHSYGVNPDVPEDKRIERFSEEAKYYEKAAEALEDDRNRFYFCSKYNPHDFVHLYNKLDDDDIIDAIIAKSKLQ